MHLMQETGLVLALGAVLLLHGSLTAPLLGLGLLQPAHHLGLGALESLMDLGHLDELGLEAGQALL